jgi:hypothetical protein
MLYGMPGLERTRLFNVRLTDAELVMLREIADARGFSLSDAMRQLIRAAHEEQELKRKGRKPK